MVEIGKNPNTNKPVYFPSERPPGEPHHIGIFGGPGIGKSFLLKKIADFAAHSDTKTFVIGAKPEYRQLAEENNIELLDLYYTHYGITAEQIIEKYSVFPRSRLYIDHDDMTPQMLHEIMRPARMRGCTVIYVAQSISLWQYDDAANRIYENTASFILLHHSKENRATEYKRFQLTESEDSFFSEWNRGLLITKSERTLFTICFPHG